MPSGTHQPTGSIHQPERLGSFPLTHPPGSSLLQLRCIVIVATGAQRGGTELGGGGGAGARMWPVGCPEPSGTGRWLRGTSMEFLWMIFWIYSIFSEIYGCYESWN